MTDLIISEEMDRRASALNEEVFNQIESIAGAVPFLASWGLIVGLLHDAITYRQMLAEILMRWDGYVNESTTTQNGAHRNGEHWDALAELCLIMDTLRAGGLGEVVAGMRAFRGE